MDVLDELRKRMDASGRQNRDVARQAQVPESAISRFMRRERELSLRSVGKIAQALGCELTLRPTRKKGSSR